MGEGAKVGEGGPVPARTTPERCPARVLVTRTMPGPGRPDRADRADSKNSKVTGRIYGNIQSRTVKVQWRMRARIARIARIVRIGEIAPFLRRP